jgi:hypothetical protein
MFEFDHFSGKEFGKLSGDALVAIAFWFWFLQVGNVCIYRVKFRGWRNDSGW